MIRLGGYSAASNREKPKEREERETERETERESESTMAAVVARAPFTYNDLVRLHKEGGSADVTVDSVLSALPEGVKKRTRSVVILKDTQVLHRGVCPPRFSSASGKGDVLVDNTGACSPFNCDGSGDAHTPDGSGECCVKSPGVSMFLLLGGQHPANDERKDAADGLDEVKNQHLTTLRYLMIGALNRDLGMQPLDKSLRQDSIATLLVALEKLDLLDRPAPLCMTRRGPLVDFRAVASSHRGKKLTVHLNLQQKKSMTREELEKLSTCNYPQRREWSICPILLQAAGSKSTGDHHRKTDDDCLHFVQCALLWLLEECGAGETDFAAHGFHPLDVAAWAHFIGEHEDEFYDLDDKDEDELVLPPQLAVILRCCVDFPWWLEHHFALELEEAMETALNPVSEVLISTYSSSDAEFPADSDLCADFKAVGDVQLEARDWKEHLNRSLMRLEPRAAGIDEACKIVERNAGMKATACAASVNVRLSNFTYPGDVERLLRLLDAHHDVAVAFASASSAPLQSAVRYWFKEQKRDDDAWQRAISQRVAAHELLAVHGLRANAPGGVSSLAMSGQDEALLSYALTDSVYVGVYQAPDPCLSGPVLAARTSLLAKSIRLALRGDSALASARFRLWRVSTSEHEDDVLRLSLLSTDKRFLQGFLNGAAPHLLKTLDRDDEGNAWRPRHEFGAQFVFVCTSFSAFQAGRAALQRAAPRCCSGQLKPLRHFVVYLQRTDLLGTSKEL